MIAAVGILLRTIQIGENYAVLSSFQAAAAGRKGVRHLFAASYETGSRGAVSDTTAARAMVIVAPGRSQRRTRRSSGRGSETQPFVAAPVESCRKIAEPRPGTTGPVLYSTTANSR